MAKSKRDKELTFLQKMQRLKDAGISDNNLMICGKSNDISEIPELNKRVEQILGIINNPQRPIANMLFFIMYDIESDKVRIQVAKYLQRNGCTRIQRSIFLADLQVSIYDKIKNDLAEVQSLYDNNDSILIVPISTDYLQAMKVIGKSIDIDIIMKNKNTLFF